ncbi:MAG: chromate transporter [Chloroflexi bacterium]|nr:chromate transporter [Chloroflexota bacterium]
MAFGAGTGMTAYLQQELVNHRKAIARDEFMTLYGLARIVPAGTMTALAVAIGFRYRGILGTIVALVAMILPSFVLTVLLTIAYSALSGTEAFRVLNVTLMPAALAVVVVSAFRIGEEFFRPSVELVLAILAFVGVLVVGLNPSFLLILGGLVGAVAIRRW